MGISQNRHLQDALPTILDYFCEGIAWRDPQRNVSLLFEAEAPKYKT
jgi:hypothetical protein